MISMSNETNIIIETARIINETNITFEVSMVIVESDNLKYIEILKSATPILTVLATILLAIWTMRANSRNLIVQMNQPEIIKNIRELSKKTRTGDKENVATFIDSEDGIYIPKKDWSMASLHQ